MTDEVLGTALAGWLQDSETTPPHAQMSAGRVMATVDHTEQLGRWWPPAVLVRKVRPAPVFGGQPPIGQPSNQPQPQTTKGVASMFTATRVIATGVAFALVSGMLLVVPSLLPGPVEPAAVLSPSPSAAAPVVSSPNPEPTTTPSADPSVLSPTASPAPDAKGQLTPSEREPGRRAIDWRSGGIEMKADALTLRVTLRVEDTVVRAQGEVLPMGTTYADHAQLEMWWFENRSQQRLNFNLSVDDTHWWIDSIWAYDGLKPDADWIFFENLEQLTRTPIGESLEGDLRVESTDASRGAFQPDGSARLRLDGLKLTAFEPGTRPAPLAGCEYLVDDRVEVSWEEGEEEEGYWSTSYRDNILQEPGEPLEGFKKMSPREVESALQEAGLCYRFDHSWRPTRQYADKRLDKELGLYFDRRCSAPRTGKVRELSFSVDHPSGGPGIIVYVAVTETKERSWPEPPSQGTDCPSQ